MFLEEDPVFPDEYPLFPEEDPVFPEEDPIFPEEDPVFPDEYPLFPEEDPVFPDEYPLFPEEDPGVPEEDPVFPEADPILPVVDPVQLLFLTYFIINIASIILSHFSKASISSLNVALKAKACLQRSSRACLFSSSDGFSLSISS